jgi:hypothetical protein
MANYFVAYDLMSLGQNYQAVEAAIKKLGTACKLLNTTWYLKSGTGLEQVRDAVWAVIDKNDKLLVIDANSATGSNLPKQCWDVVLANWQ